MSDATARFALPLIAPGQAQKELDRGRLADHRTAAGNGRLVAGGWRVRTLRRTAWTLGDVAARRLLVAGIPVVGLQQPQISAPLGGATIDVEARLALGAILGAMRAHGLIAA